MLLGRAWRLTGRLANLYKLLWVEDRLAALKDQANRSRTREARLRDRVSALQEKQALLRRRIQEQGTSLQSQINDLARAPDGLPLEHLTDQIDLLKSSVEVPWELVEEFHGWRARTSIPREPLVSVIVITHGQAPLLTERCVPSVLNQTYPNLELIVVGDGCTDDTEARMAEVRDPRLRFVNIHSPVQPADPMRRLVAAGAPALSKARSMVRGDFLAHLDDDDEYMPDRLEKLVRFVVRNDCDFVWHPFWREVSEDRWNVRESLEFASTQVINGSVLYRSWFAKIDTNITTPRLTGAGDWDWLRRIKYVGPVSMRYPEPLLKHYRKGSQD